MRVAVVNDYELVVAGVASVLREYDDRVEIVELDSRMPVVSDVDVLLYDSYGQAQGEHVDVASLTAGVSAKVVIFSWNTQAEVVDGALRAGAVGYVSKGVGGLELVEALERVHAGEHVTPATASMPDGDGFGRWPGDRHGLSPRESEVLALICQGLGNDQIAQQIFIGINTLKTHIRSLYRKVGAESRTQAVLWGVDHGFRPDRSRHIEG